MSRIVRFGKWIQRNPKKSAVFGAASAFGVSYVMEKRRVRLIMRDYGKEAKKYGQKVCPAGEAPRHVTVIMNTHTKGGKSLYEECAAPLLHLSGAKISMFKTEQSGQAKDLMKIMDNTDAVIVVGGDGTLMEAVTGLLSRDDRLEAVNRFPLGVIPTGRSNTLARKLYFKEGMRKQQMAAEAAMAVIRDIRKPIDAFKVEFHEEKLWNRDDEHATRQREIQQNHNEDLKAQGIEVAENEPTVSSENSTEIKIEESDRGKESEGDKPYLEKIDPVFGVGKVECGIFRDIDGLIDRYWYFGSLRARAAYFFNSFRSFPVPEETEIRFSDPCSGCNRCMKLPEKKEEKPSAQEIHKNQKWWGSFVKKDQNNKAPAHPYEKYANIVNEHCGQMHDSLVYTSNIEVVPENGALVLKASPLDSSIMVDGFARHSNYTTPSLKNQLKAATIQFDFPQKELTDPSYIPTMEEKRNKELLIKGKKISIDSEVFARQPISITLYPKAVNFFATI